MNVLIGDISSYKAIVISRYFKKQYPGIKVYSFDHRKFTKIIRTKYSDTHFCIKKNNIENEIKEIIRRHKINHFFPVINEDLSKFWINQESYFNSLAYLGEYSSYKVLNNKLSLYDLALKLKIKVPLRYNSIYKAKIPYVVKPTNLSSSKGVYYIHNKQDIPDSFNNKDLIIQDYIKGQGVGYSFYCKNGDIIDAYGHLRISEYPVTGGSSTYRTSFQDRRMHDIASKIVSHLNYTGFAMFEFKLTENNDIYLIEVNPRIWGSINQGLVNGVNYFDKIINIKSYKIKFNKTINTYIAPLIYISLFRYAIKFRYKPLVVFLKNFRSNAPDVSLIKDSRGYFSTILRKIL